MAIDEFDGAQVAETASKWNAIMTAAGLGTDETDRMGWDAMTLTELSNKYLSQSKDWRGSGQSGARDRKSVV